MHRIVPRLLAAGITLVVCGGVFAQSAETRLRGIISARDGDVLTIATREGATVRVDVTPDARLSAVQPLDITAIKPGTYIGTVALLRPDGSLRAVEVLVFPESMRGVGEGRRDWDLQPGSSMTNATVDAVVTAKDGRELQLSYKGGNLKVLVPESAPIVTYVPAERSELQPGVAVFAMAARGADSHLTSGRMIIGRNGVKPPM
jgi:hypothetical protein